MLEASFINVWLLDVTSALETDKDKQRRSNWLHVINSEMMYKQETEKQIL